MWSRTFTHDIETAHKLEASFIHVWNSPKHKQIINPDLIKLKSLNLNAKSYKELNLRYQKQLGNAYSANQQQKMMTNCNITIQGCVIVWTHYKSWFWLFNKQGCNRRWMSSIKYHYGGRARYKSWPRQISIVDFFTMEIVSIRSKLGADDSFDVLHLTDPK